MVSKATMKSFVFKFEQRHSMESERYYFGAILRIATPSVINPLCYGKRQVIVLSLLREHV